MRRFLILLILLIVFSSFIWAQEVDISPVRDNPPPSGSDVLPLTRISNGVSLEPQSVGQGNTLVIYLESPKALKDLEGEFLGREIRFYKTGKNRYRALIGVPLTTEPGGYNILFRIKTKGDLRVEWKEAVQVKKTVFKREKLSIPSAKSGMLTSKYLGKEGMKIWRAYEKEKLKQDWKGKFLLPTEGRISSPFGAHRIYNKGKASWRHRGVDIANKEGTEVFAPNSGRIVLSEDMRVHGGTVIMSHGQGIFSIFCHLKKRLVKKAEKVEKGQLIGLMGQTGLATGPHLHWGLCASGTAVDPLEWTRRRIGERK